jgi:hypothetical protein
MDILARIYNSTAEQHRNEHALTSAELRHIRCPEKRAQGGIGKDFHAERFGSGPNGLPSAY